MAFDMTRTRYMLRKNAGIMEDLGNSVSKFTKDHPYITRGLTVGIPSFLGISLLAKALGSDNASMLGLLGAGAITGTDQYLSRNPDKIPEWLKPYYPSPKTIA